MRYLLLIILGIHLCIAIYLAGIGLLAIAWFSAPVVISLIIEILFLLGKTKSQALSIIGAIVLTLSIPVYISELTYTGTDAQAGLLAGLMPIYQLIVLLITSVILSAKSLLGNGSNKTHNKTFKIRGALKHVTYNNHQS